MSQATPTLPALREREGLGDPELRRVVERFVRRRVPRADVEDVVQTVFVDALAARERPREAAELARWVLGIARHKVVDRHRRASREGAEPAGELPEIPTGPSPFEARSLASWAEAQAGRDAAAQKTLAWMAREGEGEKLDAIAEDEQVPAARVRQRVSRMRRWMKERWAAELAAVAMLAVLAILGYWLLKKPAGPPEAHDAPGVILPEAAPIAPEPRAPEAPPVVVERAKSLRDDALRACDGGDFRGCLDGLDDARALDPDGDRDPKVGAARARARAQEDAFRKNAKSLEVAPIPTSASTGKPTSGTPNGAPMLKSSPKKPSGPSFEDLGSAPASKEGGSKAGSVRKRASQTVLGAAWAK